MSAAQLRIGTQSRREEDADVRYGPAHEAVERLDYADRKVERPGFDRRAFLRRTALTGAAAGSSERC